MSTAITTFPSILSKSIEGVRAELQDHYCDFGEFVEELLNQLEVLRSNVDEKSRLLDEERAQVEKTREQLRMDGEGLLESQSTGADKSDLIADLEQQRDVLEEELESLRRRASEADESLAQQKREMAEERAEWSGELREMRQLLERHTRQLTESRQYSDTTTASSMSTTSFSRNNHSSQTTDPVVGSVMAQFAKLQKDANGRRPRI